MDKRKIKQALDELWEDVQAARAEEVCTNAVFDGNGEAVKRLDRTILHLANLRIIWEKGNHERICDALLRAAGAHPLQAVAHPAGH